jgi:N-methylhydantoinase B
MFIGYAAGPGLDGYDGWLTFCGADNGGMIVLDSVEIDESMYPIVVEGRWAERDTLGAGEFDGAPSTYLAFRPIADDMHVIYCSDGGENPARGVLGGSDGAPAANFKRLGDGRIVPLPAFHHEICKPGEAVMGLTCAGGGYGNPLDRDPARVAATVDRGWLSPERAESVYAVALRPAANGIEHEVDGERTAALRRQRRGEAR